MKNQEIIVSEKVTRESDSVLLLELVYELDAHGYYDVFVKVETNLEEYPREDYSEHYQKEFGNRQFMNDCPKITFEAADYFDNNQITTDDYLKMMKLVLDDFNTRKLKYLK